MSGEPWGKWRERTCSETELSNSANRTSVFNFSSNLRRGVCDGFVTGHPIQSACNAPALAQNQASVCKARVRICLYESFPRFRHFVLILEQACRARLRKAGCARGFGIKGVADHIKAGDISPAPYPPSYDSHINSTRGLFHINYRHCRLLDIPARVYRWYKYREVVNLFEILLGIG